jgi:hypothetical protein
MHFSPLNVVISVTVPTASALVACYCWLAARHLRRRHRWCREQWMRLSVALWDVDRELDQVWAVEAARHGWHN